MLPMKVGSKNHVLAILCPQLHCMGKAEQGLVGIEAAFDSIHSTDL